MSRRKRARPGLEIVPVLVLALGVALWFASSLAPALRLALVAAGFLVAVVAVVVVARFALWAARNEKTRPSAGKPAPGRTRRPTPARTRSSESEPRPVRPKVEHPADIPTPDAPEAPPPFSTEAFRRMDWLDFERFAEELFRALGFAANKTGSGADGGVDIELRAIGSPAGSLPQALVQCKARSSQDVGVDKIRELLGVVVVSGAGRGILLTNSGFTPDAVAFARSDARLLLADLDWIRKRIEPLPEEIRRDWSDRFFGPGYDIPSCVRCETKMIPRRTQGHAFWGCPNFSDPAIGCRTTLKFRPFDLRHLSN